MTGTAFIEIDRSGNIFGQFTDTKKFWTKNGSGKDKCYTEGFQHVTCCLALWVPFFFTSGGTKSNKRLLSSQCESQVIDLIPTYFDATLIICINSSYIDSKICGWYPKCKMCNSIVPSLLTTKIHPYHIENNSYSKFLSLTKGRVDSYLSSTASFLQRRNKSRFYLKIFKNVE